MAGDEHVGVVDGGGEAGLLRAVDEVVEQHAESTAGAGAERAHDLVEVVGTVEALDHHALDAQVVAPHLLDQLGVVDALDEDPAGPGHPCGLAGTATEPDAVRWSARRVAPRAWLGARPG